MATLATLDGLTPAEIATIDGVAIGGLATWNGLELASDPIGPLAPSLWLSAKDSMTLVGANVAVWPDKSTSGFDAFQDSDVYRPIYSATSLSGRPGVTLGNTVKYLVSDMTGMQDYTALTVFAMVQTPAAAAADTTTIMTHSMGDTASVKHIQWGVSSGAVSGEKHCSSFKKTGLDGRIGAGAGYTRAANTPQAICTVNSTGGTQLYVDGSEISLNIVLNMTTATDSSPAATGWTTNDYLRIGGWLNGGAPQSTPETVLSELIVFNYVLTTEQRAQVFAHLSAEWTA